MPSNVLTKFFIALLAGIAVCILVFKKTEDTEKSICVGLITFIIIFGY